MKISKESRVAVYGLGYIGLPTATFISDKGFNVIGVDINAKVVSDFNNGRVNFYEPNLQSILEKNLKNKNLYASLEPVEADIYLIVVPTPFKNNYQPDIKYVMDVVSTILPMLKKNDLIIIESTSPIGTTEKVYNYIKSERKEIVDVIFLAYCPERVIPGNLIYELEMNDRVVGGVNNESTNIARQFYTKFVKGNIYATNSKTAEMCKLVENASRDNQIAFANEISIIADKAGIDIWELINLANKHPRVNILNPSPGVGGHCIAVDPYFISSDFPSESNLIKTSRNVNNYKSFWTYEKICSSIHEFKQKHSKNPTVGLMGLSYKPNVDDLRESPSIYIVEKLIEKFPKIDFKIAEPNISDHKKFKIIDFQKVYNESDIIVFLVNHKHFKNIIINSKKINLDFCGLFQID